jgi:hypothetical protein
MMDKIWYEVAVSSPTHGSETIESFEYLENAKAFASAMCNNKDVLLELANDIECLFIDRWTWDGENYNELDETFVELRYYTDIKAEVNDG